jgi:hypothetical protein
MAGCLITLDTSNPLPDIEQLIKDITIMSKLINISKLGMSLG